MRRIVLMLEPYLDEGTEPVKYRYNALPPSSIQKKADEPELNKFQTLSRNGSGWFMTMCVLSMAFLVFVAVRNNRIHGDQEIETTPVIVAGSMNFRRGTANRRRSLAPPSESFPSGNEKMMNNFDRASGIHANSFRPAAQSSGFSSQRTEAAEVQSTADITEILTPDDRVKLDKRDDMAFYQNPRIVQHVDDIFLKQLTTLYRKRLVENSAVLDLCSSHDSHLPDDVEYAEVIGHGMNEVELKANNRLTSYFVRDFDKNPRIDLPDSSIDAVLMCASIQYMARPEVLFLEMLRVLRPGGVVIISFSDRMFYSKAIQRWRVLDDFQRAKLVRSYFQNTGGFTRPEIIRSVPLPGDPEVDPIFRGIGGLVTDLARAVKKGGVPDPFTAVVAYKEFKPESVYSPMP